jgi:hypothetical protein
VKDVELERELIGLLSKDIEKAIHLIKAQNPNGIDLICLRLKSIEGLCGTKRIMMLFTIIGTTSDYVKTHVARRESVDFINEIASSFERIKDALQGDSSKLYEILGDYLMIVREERERSFEYSPKEEEE